MAVNPPDCAPEDWLKRAGELREHAREMNDPVLKREVEKIAKAYERLAAHAAGRQGRTAMKLTAYDSLGVCTSELPPRGSD